MKEQMEAFSPEEIAKIEKRRTISDAELLKNGAEYEINAEDEKSINATPKQKEEAIKEMEKHFKNRAWIEENAKLAEEKNNFKDAAEFYEALVINHGKKEYENKTKEMYHNLAVKLENDGQLVRTVQVWSSKGNYGGIGAIEAYEKAGEFEKAEELKKKIKK